MDHILPQVHWSKPQTKSFHQKLVGGLIFNRSKNGFSVSIDTMDPKLIGSWIVYVRDLTCIHPNNFVGQRIYMRVEFDSIAEPEFVSSRRKFA